MTKRGDTNFLRRHFLIGASAGLAGALLLFAGVGASRAGGGGGGGEGGDPRANTTVLTPEARAKLKKLKDLMKKLESDIKRGKRGPMTDVEKKYFMRLLELWAQYKNAPEFQDALWAVWDAAGAAGPR